MEFTAGSWSYGVAFFGYRLSEPLVLVFAVDFLQIQAQRGF